MSACCISAMAGARTCARLQRPLRRRHGFPHTTAWVHGIYQGGSALLLKLRTAPDVAPGNYTLKGRIGFRVTSDARWAKDQQVDIALHLTVVDHDATVGENLWPWKPYGDHPGRDAFVAFITAPLIPFEVLYFMIDCDINPGHCSD